MRRIAGPALALGLLAGCTPAKSENVPPPAPSGADANPVRPPAPAEVTLRPVKVAELDRFLTEQRGRVVVLDVWAEWWLPCKKEFPQLVQLHRQYADRGLVCVSVSIDDAENRDKPLRFLQQQGATFANFLLDEPEAVRQKRFDDMAGPPVVYVYDKDGKVVKRFETPSYEEDVAPLVKKLLGEK